MAIALLILVAVVWVTTLAAAPVVASAEHPAGRVTAVIAYTAGSLVCHQRPERSFHIDGAQLPVCARCLGLYVGGLLGVMVWAGVGGVGMRVTSRGARLVASTPLRSLLAVAALPTLATVAAAWLGWWDGSNAIRAALGVPLGLVTGVVVAAVAARDLR